MSKEDFVQVIKTDKLRVRVAMFPITSLKVEFLTQVVAPMALIPKTYSIQHMMHATNSPKIVNDVLAEMILHDWNESLKEASDGEMLEDLKWMKFTEVEFIECDLLVPKP